LKINKFYLMVILSVITLLLIPTALYLALSDSMLIQREVKPGQEPRYLLMPKPVTENYTFTADSDLTVWPTPGTSWEISIKYAAQVSVPGSNNKTLEVSLNGLKVSSGLCEFDMLPDEPTSVGEEQKKVALPTLVPEEFMKVFGSDFNTVANVELLQYFKKAKTRKFIAETNEQGEIVSIEQSDRPEDAPPLTRIMREMFHPSANVAKPIWRAMLPAQAVGKGGVWKQEIEDPTESLEIDTYNIECELTDIQEKETGKIASILFTSKIANHEYRDKQTNALVKSKSILFNGKLTWNIDRGRPEKLSIGRKIDVILSNDGPDQKDEEQRVAATAITKIEWNYLKPEMP
jgi:hypothetical protein